MKIIDFWRSEGERWVNETGFNKEGFLKALSEKVPDWKEQIHDKAIWSDLHMQSNDLHEVEITKIMIEELGTEYACYLIETKTEPKYNKGRMAAIDYCVEHSDQEWDNYSDDVKWEVSTAQKIHNLSKKNGGFITSDDFINLVKEVFPPKGFEEEADESE